MTAKLEVIPNTGLGADYCAAVKRALQHGPIVLTWGITDRVLIVGGFNPGDEIPDISVTVPAATPRLAVAGEAA